jgi:mannosyltransferase
VYILYDGPYEPCPKAGVVRYFNQIADQLTEDNRVGFTRKKCSSKQNTKIQIPKFAHFRPHRVSFALELLWHKFFSKDIPKILHPTEYGLTPTGEHFAKLGSKIVVTIHDLIHEKMGAPGKLYNKKTRDNFYFRADGFIFVSNSTKNDFSEFYPEHHESRPSRVIWHGNNFPTQTTPSSSRQQQFLFVGSRNGYKNFHSALDAFNKLASENCDAVLVVAGSPPTKEEIRSTSPFESRVKWVESPSDEVLQTLYSESLSLLYVSEYEGFGMPLLEAMSRGCIPIAGNHSSVPEVLKDAGIQIDVTDPSAIANAMRKCHDDPAFADSKRLAGAATSMNFSWAKSSSQTLDFYNSL